MMMKMERERTDDEFQFDDTMFDEIQQSNGLIVLLFCLVRLDDLDFRVVNFVL